MVTDCQTLFTSRQIPTVHTRKTEDSKKNSSKPICIDLKSGSSLKNDAKTFVCVDY